MPWKAADVVDERTRFVLEYDSAEYTMAELCPGKPSFLAGSESYRRLAKYINQGF